MRFIHRNGGAYDLIGTARLQTDKPLADMAEVVVYAGSDGRLWVRAASEWDERFTRCRHPEPWKVEGSLVYCCQCGEALAED